MQSLRIAVPAAFIGTVIAAMPMVKRMDPRLYDFILGTLHREDEMHINYAYRQLLEHHDWHDGSGERGKAPFDMPSSTKEAITTAAATEEQFLSNAHSRIKRQVQLEIQRQIEDASTRAQCTEAKMQYARFVSAGGKMASRWLELPPRESRLSKAPPIFTLLFFPSHLFRIQNSTAIHNTKLYVIQERAHQRKTKNFRGWNLSLFKFRGCI